MERLLILPRGSWQLDRTPATQKWAGAQEIKFYDERRIRSIVDQYHPHPLDRRGATGRVRASRHSDGARAVGLYNLEPRHAVRPGGPDLAQPRSIRALERSRLDAALVGASPDRDQSGKC